MKLRGSVFQDGRVGFPAVVQYEITQGPLSGVRLPVPPSIGLHGEPESATPPPLSSREAAKTRAEWDGKPRSTYPYRILVHDQDEYERLRLMGFWMSAQHRGASDFVDNRKAPEG